MQRSTNNVLNCKTSINECWCDKMNVMLVVHNLLIRLFAGPTNCLSLFQQLNFVDNLFCYNFFFVSSNRKKKSMINLQEAICIVSNIWIFNNYNELSLNSIVWIIFVWYSSSVQLTVQLTIYPIFWCEFAWQLNRM